jgi:Zn-dependent protease with chaperone function
MANLSFAYPATPTGVPPSVTEPSSSFKKEVSGVMGSIILFLVVYLLLFLLSIGLVVACLYAGYYIIISLTSIFGILAGVGLIGVGIMVFVFLIKFLFAVTRHDRSGSIEVTEDDQPRLFGFIRQLTQDTQTPFPKKIYLTADVNASVSYDSSFWSMFLPIKKNLQIGLGLVNSVNISEFKAVMAHEFGHFSQRSMKLGSYVYNVNMIIHNMLFGNNSYASFLQGWANVSDTFAIFASITARIVNGIQWVLRQMYSVINKSYLRLSREMEFHADAVAASVSGSINLVTALRRIELAQSGYSIALEKYNALLLEKKISSNVYNDQRVVLKYLAQEFKLPVQHELPVVSNEFVQSNNLSRVNFKDQWASHPSTPDREKHLNDLAVEAEILHDSAWILFDNKEQLQLQLTQNIYSSAIAGGEATIGSNEFEEIFYKGVRNFTLPERYNGFYDDRQVPVINMEDVINGQAGESRFDDIFTQQHALLSKKIKASASDIEILNAISAKKVDARSFDFDGVKHDRSDAAGIAEKLAAERSRQQVELDELDRKAIRFFIQKAMQTDAGKAAELKSLYKQYFEYRQNADEFLKKINEMLEVLRPVYSGETIQLVTITLMMNTLKSEKEPAFKEWLKKWMALGALDDNPAQKERIVSYLQANYVYFNGTSFFDTELNDLHNFCTGSWNSVYTFLFMQFKAILEKQLQLLSNYN